MWTNERSVIVTNGDEAIVALSPRAAVHQSMPCIGRGCAYRRLFPRWITYASSVLWKFSDCLMQADRKWQREFQGDRGDAANKPNHRGKVGRDATIFERDMWPGEPSCAGRGWGVLFTSGRPHGCSFMAHYELEAAKTGGFLVEG